MIFGITFSLFIYIDADECMCVCVSACLCVSVCKEYKFKEKYNVCLFFVPRKGDIGDILIFFSFVDPA